MTHELNLVRTDADRKVENEQKCLNELIRIQHANNELQKQLKKLKKEERKERKGKEKLLSQRVDDENKDERKQLKGYEKKIEELTLQLNKKEQDLYFALKAA